MFSVFVAFCGRQHERDSNSDSLRMGGIRQSVLPSNRDEHEKSR